jgi:hypothetical protein
MKKLFVLSVSAFCFLSAIKAQNNDMSVKNDNDVAILYRKDVLNKKEQKEQQLEKGELENNEVSDRTVQQFYSDFGNLPIVESERIPNFEKITFIKDGTTETAYYDVNFDLVGTIAVKAFEDLPKDAKEFINKHYNDYTVKAVQFFNDNESNDEIMNQYDQEFQDADSYFVALEKDNKTTVLHVTLSGAVYFYKEI